MATLRIHEQDYQVDAILFDKDGTLLDFGALWLPWLACFIEQYNRSVPADRQLTQSVESALGVDLSAGTWDPTGPLAIGSMEDVNSILAQNLYGQGIAWNEALKRLGDVRDLVEHTFDWPQHLAPVSGLKNLLRQAFLAGVKMGVVTSDDTENAERHLTVLGITEYFNVVLGHDAVARGKPHPDMALEACSRLGVEPGRTVVFGDSNGDMQLGRDAGLLSQIAIVTDLNRTDHLTEARQIIADYGGITLTNSISKPIE